MINTVDGRNPAPVDRWFIPKIFWGFNHQRCRISSIHGIMVMFFSKPFLKMKSCDSAWCRASWTFLQVSDAAMSGTSGANAGTPRMIGLFHGKSQTKMDDLGYPHFRKPPCHNHVIWYSTLVLFVYFNGCYEVPAPFRKYIQCKWVTIEVPSPYLLHF